MDGRFDMDGHHDSAHSHSSFACSGSFVVAIIVERMDGCMDALTDDACRVVDFISSLVTLYPIEWMMDSITASSFLLSSRPSDSIG